MAKTLFLPAENWIARPGHIPSIDGVRAFSILVVLIAHILLPKNLVGISAFGLKVFFFISGFLITRLLLSESAVTGRINLGTFYLRRILRLYPVIIVVVVVSIIFSAFYGVHVRLIDVAAVFFYFVNYVVIYYDRLGGAMSLPVGVLWSLSIEEHFYLFAPLAIIALNYSARKLAIWAAALCLLCLSLRILYAHNDPHIVETLELYWRSETRFDSIAFGMLLACMTEFEAGRNMIKLMVRRRVFVIALCLLLLTFMVRGHYFQNVFRFSLQGLILIPIVAGVVFSAPVPIINRVLNSQISRTIGALSYSLYVWHGVVPFIFGPWLRQLNPTLELWVRFFVCFVVAAISYKFIERPVLGLRRKLRTVAATGKSVAQPTA